VDGRVLTFRLVGINNQNFVMQDVETGTWWQQVSGEAILGPLKGRRLAVLAFDQLTFGVWKAESPRGRVLAPNPAVAAREYDADWEADIAPLPVPLSASADLRLAPRALVIGIDIGGAARAYRVEDLTAARLVLDELGGTALAIVRAPDGRSTRVFDRRVDGRIIEMIVDAGAPDLRLLDASTGSAWNFAGVAVSGPLAGRRLTRIPFLEEYWFDWKTYHPGTDVARGAR
jgi:hypothetical protein